MKSINVFHTRIEISPYELGECRKLENMCSYYDPVTHCRVYIGCRYDEDRETLIIPRGVNQMVLNKFFKSIPTNIPLEQQPKRMSNFYTMITPPKDETQVNAIKFLSHKDEYAKNSTNSQFGLNLDTGVGKTYCMVNSIITQGLKAIIICTKDSIKNQWIKTFLEMSTMKEDMIYDVTGSRDLEAIRLGEIDCDVYVTNHQTLWSYIKLYGEDKLGEVFNNAGIGIKVYDEAHMCFNNILNVDMCTDVKYNYYLTATFGRGDQKEVAIYKRAFAALSRYGENIEKRRHTIFNIMYYTSNATYKDNIRVQTNYGFNNYRFWDYCHNVDKDENIIYVLLKIINKLLFDDNIEGKILITSPMIESADYIGDILKEKYPDIITGTIHSKKSKEDNKYNREYADIISTTIKSLGTGDDVNKLRVIINLDPHSSSIITKQLIGRLREYAPDKDTYFYDLVDVSFNSIINMLNKRLPTIKKICKDVKRYKLF